MPPKQIAKQSMRELIQFALDMPAHDLTKYGTLFLSGPIPDKMTRGELIALQLVERASFGDLDAVKEIRAWTADTKDTPKEGTTYYQFLIQMAGGKAADTKEAALGMQQIARVIETTAKESSSSVLDDLT